MNFSRYCNLPLKEIWNTGHLCILCYWQDSILSQDSFGSLFHHAFGCVPQVLTSFVIQLMLPICFA